VFGVVTRVIVHDWMSIAEEQCFERPWWYRLYVEKTG